VSPKKHIRACTHASTHKEEGGGVSAKKSESKEFIEVQGIIQFNLSVMRNILKPQCHVESIYKSTLTCRQGEVEDSNPHFAAMKPLPTGKSKEMISF